MPAIFGAAGFVAVSILMWFIDPSSRPIALIAGLFFGGGLIVLLLVQFVGAKNPSFHRLMGAAMTVVGLGCAVGAYYAIVDPATVETIRYRASMILVICVLGAVFFGLGGLYLLIRGNRSKP